MERLLQIYGAVPGSAGDFSRIPRASPSGPAAGSTDREGASGRRGAGPSVPDLLPPGLVVLGGRVAGFQVHPAADLGHVPTGQGGQVGGLLLIALAELAAVGVGLGAAVLAGPGVAQDVAGGLRLVRGGVPGSGGQAEEWRPERCLPSGQFPAPSAVRPGLSPFQEGYGLDRWSESDRCAAGWWPKCIARSPCSEPKT